MVIVEESKICVFNSLPQKSCCRLDSSSQRGPIAASTSFHKPWGFCRNWKKPGTGSFLQIWLRWQGQCVRSRPERTIINITPLIKPLTQDTSVVSGWIFIGNCNHKSHLELVPLFAKIDADIRTSDGQVGAAAVEAKIPHLRDKTAWEFWSKRVWTQVVNVRPRLTSPHSPRPSGGSWSSSVFSNPRASRSCHQPPWQGSNLANKRF